MNKPLLKDEYQKRVNEFLGSFRYFEQAKKLLQKLKLERVHKYANIVNSENSTGDFIQNSRNCIHCFDMSDSEDCRNVWLGVQIKDTFDCSNMYEKSQLNYQVLGTIDTYHVAYTTYAFNSSDILYCDMIYHSKNLFGCAGLKKKQYCILNKQYTKEAYEMLVPKIIQHMKKTGEWGQFLPVKFSPHGYNDTLANEYYPLTKDKVIAKSWNWQEEEDFVSYRGPEVTISDNIKEVPEDITEKILRCEVSGKPYKIMKQELKFYRDQGIPIPRKCPDQRYDERLKVRNPRIINNRACGKCSAPIATPYSPDRPEKVYCEKCYRESVY